MFPVVVASTALSTVAGAAVAAAGAAVVVAGAGAVVVAAGTGAGEESQIRSDSAGCNEFKPDGCEPPSPPSPPSGQASSTSTTQASSTSTTQASLSDQASSTSTALTKTTAIPTKHDANVLENPIKEICYEQNQSGKMLFTLAFIQHLAKLNSFNQSGISTNDTFSLSYRDLGTNEYKNNFNFSSLMDFRNHLIQQDESFLQSQEGRSYELKLSDKMIFEFQNFKTLQKHIGDAFEIFCNATGLSNSSSWLESVAPFFSNHSQLSSATASGARSPAITSSNTSSATASGVGATVTNASSNRELQKYSFYNGRLDLDNITELCNGREAKEGLIITEELLKEALINASRFNSSFFNPKNVTLKVTGNDTEYDSMQDFLTKEGNNEQPFSIESADQTYSFKNLGDFRGFLKYAYDNLCNFAGINSDKSIQHIANTLGISTTVTTAFLNTTPIETTVRYNITNSSTAANQKAEDTKAVDTKPDTTSSTTAILQDSQVLNSSTTPSPSQEPSNGGGDGLSLGAQIGISVGATVVGVPLIIFALYKCYNYKNNQKEQDRLNGIANSRNVTDGEGTIVFAGRNFGAQDTAINIDSFVESRQFNKGNSSSGPFTVANSEDGLKLSGVPVTLYNNPYTVLEEEKLTKKHTSRRRPAPDPRPAPTQASLNGAIGFGAR